MDVTSWPIMRGGRSARIPTILGTSHATSSRRPEKILISGAANGRTPLCMMRWKRSIRSVESKIMQQCSANLFATCPNSRCGKSTCRTLSSDQSTALPRPPSVRHFGTHGRGVCRFHAGTGRSERVYEQPCCSSDRLRYRPAPPSRPFRRLGRDYAAESRCWRA